MCFKENRGAGRRRIPLLARGNEMVFSEKSQVLERDLEGWYMISILAFGMVFVAHKGLKDFLVFYEIHHLNKRNFNVGRLVAL